MLPFPLKKGQRMNHNITEIQQPIQFGNFQLWVVKYKEQQSVRQKNFGQLQLAWNFYNQHVNRR